MKELLPSRAPSVVLCCRANPSCRRKAIAALVRRRKIPRVQPCQFDSKLFHSALLPRSKRLVVHPGQNQKGASRLVATTRRRCQHSNVERLGHFQATLGLGDADQTARFGHEHGWIQRRVDLHEERLLRANSFIQIVSIPSLLDKLDRCHLRGFASWTCEGSYQRIGRVFQVWFVRPCVSICSATIALVSGTNDDRRNVALLNATVKL
mmetsp:Transcript_33891/g.93613  ORF Transcript_33891/g.93613 Transcript_33891/m.93613 type:complete len:208 (+) Transcript_33891:557-1180(+)